MNHLFNVKMDFSIVLEVFAAVATALGGWEAIKYLLNRKTNQRKEEAEADSVEFGVLKDTIMFLQEQMHNMVISDAEKEKRFIEQTTRLRKVQDENSQIQKEKSKLELELQKYKCIREKCPNRQPPNGL